MLKNKSILDKKFFYVSIKKTEGKLVKSNIYNYTIPNSGEDFNTLFESKNIKLVRIVSSENIEPQEYIQEEDEYVILLEGSATLEIDGEIKKLVRGDALLIPAKTPHRVLQISRGALWLAVYVYCNIDTSKKS